MNELLPPLLFSEKDRLGIINSISMYGLLNKLNNPCHPDLKIISNVEVLKPEFMKAKFT
jgi:hypothetical protein